MTEDPRWKARRAKYGPSGTSAAGRLRSAERYRQTIAEQGQRAARRTAMRGGSRRKPAGITLPPVSIEDPHDDGT